MSLINKINVGNTDYDIQDRLMPDAIGQAGQVLKVKDDGSCLEFSTIESGEKLYSHYVALTHSVYGNSWIHFYSSRSTAYTFDDLQTYIESFGVGNFIATVKVKDSQYGYLYNARVESCPGYIEIWYTVVYGNDFTSSKQGNSLVSDTVTEI